MDFLKDVLGSELYEKVSDSIEAYNSNEANQNKQIKIANLASGDYVSKGKFESLNTLLKGRELEIAEGKALIEQLQKASEGDEELKMRAETYEKENECLRAELEHTKAEYALRIALLKEKADDVDYLVFKADKLLKEQGEKLELDGTGAIKGGKELIAKLKEKCPNRFETEEKKGEKSILERRLETGRETVSGLTKAQLMKMSYNERVAIKENNPELYNFLMNS